MEWTDLGGIHISYCTICDKDKDPLEVPTIGCGHPGEKNRAHHFIDVVAKSEAEAAVALLKAQRDALAEALSVALYATMLGQGETYRAIARSKVQSIIDNAKPKENK